MTRIARPSHSRWAVVLLAGTVVLLPGCGPNPVGPHPENYRLLMRLNTAVMGKRADLLVGIRASADQLLAEGKLNQAAHVEISAVITAGSAGDWSSAQSQCLAIQKGQPPLPESTYP